MSPKINLNIHPLALVICVIWICSTVAVCVTGIGELFAVAFMATLMCGVGYGMTL